MRKDTEILFMSNDLNFYMLGKLIFLCVIFGFLGLDVVLPLINKSILQKVKKAKNIQELPKNIKAFLKRNDFSQEKISHNLIELKSSLLKVRKLLRLFFKIVIILEILVIVSRILFYILTNNKTILNDFYFTVNMFMFGIGLAIWIIFLFFSKSFINYFDILLKYLPPLLNGRGNSNVNSPSDKSGA